MAVTRLNSGRMIHMPATSIVDIISRLDQTQLENHTSANTQHKHYHRFIATSKNNPHPISLSLCLPAI
ncbi:Uncharacterized protein HZ326_22045, partial [Fusarium oxysporum f. sp. albedinis]